MSFVGYSDPIRTLHMVRVGRLELPASCSQSKRATNCATPGYKVFQLWSNMWSTPIFDQLPAMGKVLSAQLSQGFPGFQRATARTWASRTQSRRATNCATPGYEVVGWPGRILPKLSVRSTCTTPIHLRRYYAIESTRLNHMPQYLCGT